MKQDTLKSVMTKLSSQKVELKSVDIVRKQSDTLKSEINKYDKMLSDVNSSLSRFRDEYIKTAKEFASIADIMSLLDSNVETIKDELKKLGMNVNDVPAIKAAEKVLQDAQEYDGVLESDFQRYMK